MVQNFDTMKRKHYGPPRLRIAAMASPSLPNDRVVPVPPFSEGYAINAPPAPVALPPTALPERRADAPLLLDYATGSLSAALSAVQTPEDRACSAAVFLQRAEVESTRVSSAARLKAWHLLAAAAGFSGPLTALYVQTVVGALLRARYRSAQSYFQAAKREHILRYKTWDADLDLIISAQVSRACARGQGPPARASPFPLVSVGKAKELHPERFANLTLAEGSPAHPYQCAVIATWALLREIEVSNVTLADVKTSSSHLTFTIMVPASKADVTALGSSITLYCVCHLQLTMICPYCVGRAHLRHLVSLHGSDPASFGSTPLFPTMTGTWPTKQGVVQSISSLAAAANEAPSTRRGASKWGGHAFRRGGAHLLAALGLSREDIKAIARHSSNAIDGYLEGANLTYITRILPMALQNAAAPVSANPLAAESTNVPWVNVAMSRGGKTHRVAANSGRSLCGWPWSASFSRCSDAGAGPPTCQKCLAAVLRAQAPSSSSRARSPSLASTASTSGSSSTRA